MARQTRIEYPGATHHVMGRGDRRENMFLDDVDRQDFVKKLWPRLCKTPFCVVRVFRGSAPFPCPPYVT